MDILVADDHALFRSGLTLLIREFNKTGSILEAGSFTEVIERLRAGIHPDLLLLDLQMPGGPWEEGMRSIRHECDDIRIVVVTGSDDHADIIEAFHLGAVGYIPKSSSPAVLIDALGLVMKGQIYVPPVLVSRESAKGHARAGDAEPGGPSEISDRQLEVLQELRRGHSNKIIARHLNLSEGTVKLHVGRLLKVLRAGNRTQAVVRAEEMGLL